MATIEAAQDTARIEGSLGGMWAHTLDEDGAIKNQVQIIRPAPQATWLVQFYSFSLGQPTDLACISESILTDPERCRMYLNSEDMNFAYEHGSLGHHSRWIFDQKSKTKAQP